RCKAPSLSDRSCSWRVTRRWLIRSAPLVAFHRSDDAPAELDPAHRLTVLVYRNRADWPRRSGGQRTGHDFGGGLIGERRFSHGALLGWPLSIDHAQEL